MIEFLQDERDRYFRQCEDLKDRLGLLEEELGKLAGVSGIQRDGLREVRVGEEEILEAGSKEEDEDAEMEGEGLELNGEVELPPGEFVHSRSESGSEGNGGVLRLSQLEVDQDDDSDSYFGDNEGSENGEESLKDSKAWVERQNSKSWVETRDEGE